jgi:molecular chaperone GrpE
VTESKKQSNETRSTAAQSDADTQPTTELGDVSAAQNDQVETAAPSAEEQLQAALAERDALMQKWLLAVADLDNYRRRVQKELEQERRFAALPLARDLLPALDNLHRALEAARSGGDVKQLGEGVQMVSKQFDDLLAKHGVVPIDAVGKPFDPNLHQAIQQMPSPDNPPMTVLSECERGYTLRERVVRPSTVIVSAPAVETSEKN